jgi:hypothetical protein
MACRFLVDHTRYCRSWSLPTAEAPYLRSFAHGASIRHPSTLIRSSFVCFRYLAIMAAGAFRAVGDHIIPILTTLASQIIGVQIRYMQQRDTTSNSRAISQLRNTQASSGTVHHQGQSIFITFPLKCNTAMLLAVHVLLLPNASPSQSRIHVHHLKSMTSERQALAIHVIYTHVVLLTIVTLGTS